MDELSAFLGRYKMLLTIMFALASLPFFARLLEIGPPWPDSSPAITSVALILTPLAVFSHANGKMDAQIMSLRRKVLFVLLASFVSYFCFASIMTLAIPNTGSAGVFTKGFVCDDLGRTLPELKDRCPFFLSIRDLNDVGYDPTKLWAEWSIQLTNVVIFFLWLVSACSAGAYISTFALRKEA